MLIYALLALAGIVLSLILWRHLALLGYWKTNRQMDWQADAYKTGLHHQAAIGLICSGCALPLESHEHYTAALCSFCRHEIHPDTELLPQKRAKFMEKGKLLLPKAAK